MVVLYRRPVETLLSESDESCLKASEDGVDGSCEVAQHFTGQCHDAFKTCYTDCGHNSSENDELGSPVSVIAFRRMRSVRAPAFIPSHRSPAYGCNSSTLKVK